MNRVLGAALVLAVAVAAASEEPERDVSSLRLAVAPFDRVGPVSPDMPDVAMALTLAFERRGVAQLLGPDHFASGTRDALAVAQNAGVDDVVTGRVTRLGNRLSVDVRLRSTRSGGLRGTFVAEVPIGDDIGPAVESLAKRIVLGALTFPEGDARVLAGVPPMVGDPSAGGVPETGVPVRSPEPSSPPPFGLGDLAGHPLSIRADELEATEREGRRTLIFREAVEVHQSDLDLTANQLAADYVAGEKQPRRLVASGDVKLRQGEREASCDRAVYEREADRITCSGNAQLRDGRDEIQGEQITFDLAGRGVTVEGGTTLRLYPEGAGEGEEGQLALPDGQHDASAPMQVRADRLTAVQGVLLHRIVLEGGVEVVQSGVTLRSQRLEVLYADGARHPERLEATGEVTLTQGTRDAVCEKAVYREIPHRLDCLGGALREGDDRVEGDVIRFDLDEDRIFVDGRARLLLVQRSGDAAGGNP